MRALIGPALFGLGLLVISVASNIAVVNMALWIRVGMVGVNLIGWGFLLINSDIAEPKKEEGQEQQ